MPRKALGDRPLTPAERQAHQRAKHKQQREAMQAELERLRAEMTDATEHTYPDKSPPGTHWALDAAWEILDSVKPGVISADVRAFLGGQIAGRLMRERWQPIATAPHGDLLLWVPPSPLLDGLIAGHVEIGRPSDRATHWMPLPEPPRD